MSETSDLVRMLADQFGLQLDDQRLANLVAAYESAMSQMAEMSIEPNPVPQPTAFSASWSERP